MESEHPFGADWASGFEYGTQFAEESWMRAVLKMKHWPMVWPDFAIDGRYRGSEDAEGDASEAEAESTESPDAEVEDDPSRAEDIEAFLQNVESFRTLRIPLGKRIKTWMTKRSPSTKCSTPRSSCMNASRSSASCPASCIGCTYGIWKN